MKSLCCVLTLGFAAAALLGCGVKRADFMTNTASLAPEPQQIWTRPNETTIDMAMENTVGFSSQTVLLGFTIKGDKPASSFRFAFVRFGDNYGGYAELSDLGQMDNIAIGRAIQKANADGLYITSLESDSTGLWPFYVKRSAQVVGKPVTLRDLGTVDVQRYEQRKFWELISGYEKDETMEDLLSGEGSIFGAITGD